jgi:PAS domain S-box-containing protein
MGVRPAAPAASVDVAPAPEVLAAALAASADGTALLDENGRCAYVNAAACTLLGMDASELLGRPLPFDVDGDEAPCRERRRSVRWRPPDSPREHELELRSRPLHAGQGVGLTVVTFRDVTDARVQQRRFTAFATAAANVARSASLRRTLDVICAELVDTTDLAAAQTFLIDPSGTRMRVHGAAPIDRWPPDFVVRLEEARRRGARLASLDALEARRPVVARRRKEEMLADPAWAPLHDQLASFEWEDFVSVPLVVEGRPLGALNAYYRPGHDPDDDEIAFLTAMAHQAAVAVENARLVAEVRGKAALDERHRLARELHDSACQQLFSMTLHLRAATLDSQIDESTRALLATLDRLAHVALEDMRALIFELHPTLLATEGLVAAVREQAVWITRRGGPAVTVEAPAERLDIAADAELDAYRLVQEALQNCVKHAAATHVDVRIGPDADNPRSLLLEVADDGRGFDPTAPAAGFGLVSMRERAERLGGELHVGPRRGDGTVLRLVAPRVLGSPR